VFGGTPNTARETRALPTHPSAFLKGRVKGGRVISDFSKYFGNISEKQPFSEKISDYFFRSATVPVAVRGVSPHFRAMAGQSQSKWVKPMWGKAKG
jgi:hypothetical protein